MVPVIVSRWDSSHLYSIAAPVGRRLVACPASNRRYTPLLPIDQKFKLVRYAIDKKRACFVKVGEGRASRRIGEEVDREVFKVEKKDTKDLDLLCRFSGCMDISTAKSTVNKHEGMEAPPENEWEKYGFKESSLGELTFVGIITDDLTMQYSKGAAVLDRGHQFALILATSDRGSDAQTPNCLRESSWSEKVRHIAAMVGCHFLSPLDTEWYGGRAGQYHTCHPEKKLIVYFIEKHVFMPSEKEPDPNLKYQISKCEAALTQGKERSSAWAKWCHLEETKSALDCQLSDVRDKIALGGDEYSQQDVRKIQDLVRVAEKG
ncbi:hypothetical protein P154DRAFT_572376 [Amniculicola lignicola CBS 123094]|uniref:Single-strand DNA deaminase toxin A-like C-terminal domain-containing protein n=1 Tax=Amniculicola lignicola CBS 123094 TaxID=1392246 RepID=A0A6A5WTD7_9PLEO|nr:hypothetical protein P154DRAFT_572376 [Amniculicola lignicola CBS 123094]